MAQHESSRCEVQRDRTDTHRAFWSDIAARWYSRVYALALARCRGDEDAAHEATQETFLALGRAHARGALASKPQAIYVWFRRTICRQVVMYYRRQRSVLTYDPARDNRMSLPDHSYVDDQDEFQVLMAKILRAIVRLSEADCEVLLVDLETGTVHEADSRRGAPSSGAYRQRKSRALKRLRRAVLACCA